MASHMELLQGIRPNMKLDKTFFLKIYGYEISFPGFADKAVKALEDAGCSKAREYYEMSIGEYQAKQDKGMNHVAAWYREECEKEWKKKQEKRGELERKQKKQTGRERWTELSRILNFQ